MPRRVSRASWLKRATFGAVAANIAHDCVLTKARRTRTQNRITYAGDVFNLNMDGYYASEALEPYAAPRYLERASWADTGSADAVLIPTV